MTKIEEIESIINKFIDKMGYKNNQHVLGVVFCGSYLTGLYHEGSDIDLQIIFDNSDTNHMIRGNDHIDGIRIEYFEKPIIDHEAQIKDSYTKQDNAIMSIIGKGKIIYAKDDQIVDLQKRVVEKFSCILPRISDEELAQDMLEIKEMLEKLEYLKNTNNDYFYQVYYLTIEKITRLYHNINCIPKMEPSKAFKIYTDKRYQAAFNFYKIPDEEFLNEYFKIIENNSMDKEKLLETITEWYKSINKPLIPLPEKLKEKSSKPPLSPVETREEISIIDNKMEKLTSYAYGDSPYFTFYYYIVIDRLFKFYHKRLGMANISAYQVFTSDNLKEVYDMCYDEEFLTRYSELVLMNFKNKIEALEKVNNFYRYVSSNRKLGDTYRFPIKSRVRDKL